LRPTLLFPHADLLLRSHFDFKFGALKAIKAKSIEMKMRRGLNGLFNAGWLRRLGGLDASYFRYPQRLLESSIRLSPTQF
jgi:hypothetical protein